MLFKPSPRTTTLMKRGNWLFVPLWLGTAAYIWLSGEGVIPQNWSKFFFPVFGLLFAANFIYALVALRSAREDAKKSQHPDPDVAALIDGHIDITEYGRRKSEAPLGSSLPEGQRSPPLSQNRATQSDA